MIWTNLGKRLAALDSRTKTSLVVAIDAVFLPICLLGSVSLRLGSLEAAMQTALWLQLALGLMTIPVLAAAGLYRTVVRFIEVRVVARAGVALAAAVVLMYGLAMAIEVRILPRSSLVMYWFVAFTYVITSRFLARSAVHRGLVSREGRPRLRMAIYGAGDAGAQLARTMQISREYQTVCFVDDHRELQGKTVVGLPVYAPHALDTLIERHAVDQFVVAIPSANAAQRRQLLEKLEPAGLPVRIMPGLVDLVSGRARVSDIRELDVADLLARDPVAPDPRLFSRDIAGKVVLVTGAGGSIGSELCRQIMTQRPRRLLMLDHTEFSLYTIEQELRPLAAGIDLQAHLGSVIDESLMTRLMREQGVQTVYHAAAYKHVPMVESNMQQGLRNNIFGSLHVVRAAQAAQVETCVLVSTDKAVRPTNVMGASKRVAELIFQAAAQRSELRTRFSMVRFGNVLGSSGSVVPLFKQQIRSGGPITITHADIIRYFMLIPEAAQLVIQAGAMASGGEVFVLDMGPPVRITDLARSMIRLAGLKERTTDHPDGDIEIQFVGLRPGEKLYEELLIGDNVVPSGHPRIMSARERHIDPALLDKMLASMRQACDSNDPESMLRQLRNLVPEFRPPEEVNAEVAAALAER
jgi:FlaA1/EpsC-like NDP-sugar epimerase